MTVCCCPCQLKWVMLLTGDVLLGSNNEITSGTEAASEFTEQPSL